MRIYLRRAFWFITILLLLAGAGCGNSGSAKKKSAADSNGLEETIGMYAEIFASEPIRVSGYTLVGGLNGTGSSECPVQIRAYLQKYLQQRTSNNKISIDELLNSNDTSVVMVEGMIPPAAQKNQKFDVRISALQGGQTTSLEGGWLYGADLFEPRQLGQGAKPLATVEGPVFIDSTGTGSQSPTVGYVLGGGTVVEEYKINITLRLPDYRIASQIRNRINERFGFETAVALAPGSIELRIPARYTESKRRFIQLVRALYLVEDPAFLERRMMTNIEKLAYSKDKDSGEIALEVIGNASVPKLAGLLNSSDPEVRFRSARCMFNLGDSRGKETLRVIALDKNSSCRMDAVEALASAPSDHDTTTILRSLLRDDDLAIRLAAYENLVRLKDSSVNRRVIAGSFYLDEITQAGKPAILVSRREQQRVALLGAPIYVRDNIFIETEDKTITINVPAGEKAVTIIRKHPRRPETIIHLKSSLDLAEIIEKLCREPMTPSARGGPGLGVSYSTMTGLLKKMVDSGAVQAEFYAGPLPKALPVNPQ
jgi:hypothetical protein